MRVSSIPLVAPNDIPRALQMEWYKIRDLFFGQNDSLQNILGAIEKAFSCQHPDARWLYEVCVENRVITRLDAKRVFSVIGQNDARALCFHWLLGNQRDTIFLRRSAELGFAFAQALMVEYTDDEDTFKFAQLAATQGERDGFFWLGRCFREGDGCGKDLDKAKKNCLLASELGHVQAMSDLGGLLDESDPQRWLWWARAAALENSWSFLFNYAKQVKLFNAGFVSAAIMFAIGQALQGNVDDEAGTIFGHDFDSFYCNKTAAKQAVAFYEAQIKATKEAMHAWVQVGVRWRVVKDIRKLIAKLIWDAREEALYKYPSN